MSLPKKSPLIITMADYQRLVRVLRALYQLCAHTGVPPALFFSVIGSILLNSTYGLNAQPRAGAAAFRLHTAYPALMYGKLEGEAQTLVAEEYNFHVWIESDGRVMDLCAPYFGEALPTGANVGAKMFQKKLSDAKTHHSLVTSPGDFMLVSDDALKRKLLEQFMASPAHVDLVGIAGAWFKPTPRKMEQVITLTSQSQKREPLALAPLELMGAW